MDDPSPVLAPAPAPMRSPWSLGSDPGPVKSPWGPTSRRNSVQCVWGASAVGVPLPAIFGVGYPPHTH
eukprot:13008007-Heterocapsa_arctica.AAC.1